MKIPRTLLDGTFVARALLRAVSRLVSTPLLEVSKSPGQLTRTLPALFALGFLTACRRDMQDQPKYKPLQKSEFFADGRSARPIPANTVAWDELNDNDPEHTGEANGVFLDAIPLPVNETLLKRGRQRFDIFCSPCHGLIGDGNGMVAQRGFRIPADLHTDRLRQVPPGYIFEVITNGYGAMPEHRDQIPVDDRWAIVAYVRALQLSRNAKITDVPAGAVNQLGVQQ